MKKLFLPIIVLISLGIIMYVVFAKADYVILSNDEALKIGEEKYLKFLWMVDGAFNSDIYGEFEVNGKMLSSEDKIFKCQYESKKSDECIANNFEEEFSKLFIQNIKYDNVYNDGIMNNRYKYQNGKYVFYNSSCSMNRMGLSHEIKVIKIDNEVIEYKVSFENVQKKIVNEKSFNLVLENNEWKISKAFYYDLCEIKYYIY